MRLFIAAIAVAATLSPHTFAQYKTGTEQPLDLKPLPQGTTTGTADNGNKQVTIPTGKNTYVYGQDASQQPTRNQPASTGAAAGVGWRFK